MAADPNKLYQFWQELKRRRVVHVITVYATSAFVIIELINNLAEPLNLPNRLATIVIAILAVGFPLTIVLSWLYDLTSKGVERTKPLSETKNEEKTFIPNAWKIATIVSFAVIIGLVVLNIIGIGKQVRHGEIKSLLILPFQNYTGDIQLDVFISGMHAALIGDVGRISDLNVISKTTSDVYKDADMTIAQIASELGVDVIVEPAVMRLGDSIFFQLKMISPEEEQLWIAEYRELKNNIPNLHNLVTKQIADEMKIELSADQDRILAESNSVEPEALDAYFKGLLYLDKIDRESLIKAGEQFNRTIEIEPAWAPPYASLAEANAYAMQMSFVKPSTAIPKIYENLNMALELDPNSSIAHYTKAVVAVWTEWNWGKGEQAFKKSLELNPSNALCRTFYAHLLMILRRFDEAYYQGNLALKLDPDRVFVRSLNSGAVTKGDPQAAIKFHKETLALDPNHRFTLLQLAVAYRDIGEYEKWYELWKRKSSFDDGDIAEIDRVFQEEGYLAATEIIIKLEEEAASEKQVNIGGHVTRYLELGQYDKAMDWLEKGYEIHHPSMPYITTRWDQLKDNSRYIALLEKMNLPLPQD